MRQCSTLGPTERLSHTSCSLSASLLRHVPSPAVWSPSPLGLPTGQHWQESSAPEGRSWDIYSGASRLHPSAQRSLRSVPSGSGVMAVSYCSVPGAHIGPSALPTSLWRILLLKSLFKKSHLNVHTVCFLQVPSDTWTHTNIFWVCLSVSTCAVSGSYSAGQSVPP